MALPKWILNFQPSGKGYTHRLYDLCGYPLQFKDVPVDEVFRLWLKEQTSKLFLSEYKSKGMLSGIFTRSEINRKNGKKGAKWEKDGAEYGKDGAELLSTV